MKLYLIGGFLGSGKTTAIQNACLQLSQQQITTAVITNDQGTQLVDTAFIKSLSIPVEEVSNGCFCCNYNVLRQQIETLQKSVQPQIIFAESVGSCTDLIATIVKPLAQSEAEIKVVVSVFADAALLWTLINGTSSFLNDQVRYLYKKQLEEADVLVVNKIDLVSQEELEKLKRFIEESYGTKIIIFQNSLQPENIQQWLHTLDQFELPEHRKSLAINYETYAQGEAMLAWLDAEVHLHTQKGIAWQTATNLIHAIYTGLQQQHYTIGHLKFLIDDGKRQQKISFTATSKTKFSDLYDTYKAKNVVLLINARVQTKPDLLKMIIMDAIQEISARSNSKILLKTVSAFEPGYPTPTHRME